MTATEIAILAACVGPVLGAVIAWWVRGKTQAKALEDSAKSDRDALREQISVLRTQVAVQQTQIDPFWKAIQNQLADSLHHPDAGHEEMDMLIDALRTGTISNGQRLDLERRLSGIKGSDASPVVRDTAGALLGIIPMVIAETAAARVVATKAETKDATEGGERA